MDGLQELDEVEDVVVMISHDFLIQISFFLSGLSDLSGLVVNQRFFMADA